MTTIASGYLGDGKSREASETIRAAFFLRLLSSALISCILFAAAGLISEKAFHSPRLEPLLKIASLGVLTTSVFNYFKYALWAHQSFKKYFTLMVLTDSGKLFAVLALTAAGYLTTLSATLVYSLAPLIGAVPALAHFNKKLFPKEKILPGMIGRLLKYSKWLFLSETCKTAVSSFDLFIIAHILGSNAAGQYGLASNLMYLFPIFLISLRAALMPHMARFSQKEQFIKYIRRSLTYSLWLGLGLLPLLFFSKHLILFFFGSRYINSVHVFNILLVVNIISPVMTTLYTALQALYKPFILAMLDLIRLLAMIIGAIIATQRFGLTGPPFVLLFINIATLAYLLQYLLRLLQRKDITFGPKRSADLVEN